MQTEISPSIVGNQADESSGKAAWPAAHLPDGQFQNTSARCKVCSKVSSSLFLTQCGFLPADASGVLR